MAKLGTLAVVLGLVLFAAFFAGCAQKPAEKPAAEEKPEVKKMTIKGRVYTNGHGGHLSVTDIEIDPATKEVRVVAGPARLKAAGYGSEKASHAVSLSRDGRILYWAPLDGTIAEIDLDAVGLTFEKTPWGKLKRFGTYIAKDVEWKELGGKEDALHCGSSLSPDGRLLYVSSIASGAVLVYDTEKHQKVDKIPVDAFLCTAEVTRDGKYLYAANMASGVLDKVNLKTGEVVKRVDLTPYKGYFIHIGEIEPMGRYLWQTAANEFRQGKPYNIPVEGAAGIGEGYIIIYDTVRDEPVESIKVPGNPHDVTFTPRGRFAISSVRHPPSDPTSSAIVVLNAVDRELLRIKDVQTGEVVKEFDVCNSCHRGIGADLSKFVDPETKVLVNLGLLEHPETGIALHCGIDIAWYTEPGAGYGAGY
ncbi:YncE family protein [Candidatus Pyrohabitans sp.]